MPVWQNTKTDWQGYHNDTQVYDPTTDNVGANDLNRWEGNMQYLKDEQDKIKDGTTQVADAAHADNADTVGGYVPNENPTPSTAAMRDGDGNLKAVEIIPSKGVKVSYSGSFSSTASHNTVYDALKTKILLNGDIIKASGFWGTSLIVGLYYAPFPNVTPTVGTVWIKYISGGSILGVQFVDGIAEQIGQTLVIVI
jgi:hypothetical protein